MNVLLDNLDLYASAFVGTVELFLVAAVGSIIGGLLLAAMRVSPVPVLRVFGAGYVNIVRNTPLTLVFFFFAFAYPRLEIADLSFFARACLALIVYTCIGIIGYKMTAAWQFYLLAFLVGTVQGGSQALSRSLFATMIPRHKSSEFFGFFAVFEKFAGIFGPAVFAVTVSLTGSSRNAILSVIAFQRRCQRRRRPRSDRAVRGRFRSKRFVHVGDRPAASPRKV